jgi:Protein of unknown function (DUF3352)
MAQHRLQERPLNELLQTHGPCATSRRGHTIATARLDHAAERTIQLPSSTALDSRPRTGVRPRGRLALGLASLAVTALLGGCGSSSTPGSSADPAGVVPATAKFFASATVRPTGALKSAAQSDGRALTHQADPYLRLLAALQTPGAPQLSFSRDVAPWLGTRAGVYLSSLSSAGSLLGILQEGLLGGSSPSASFPFGSSGAQGAIVLDTSDAAKAKSFLDKEAGHAGAHSTSYRGVSYQLGSGGVAFAMVDRLAVIGSESGIHGVIDTAKGGSPLTHQESYAKLLAKAPAVTLAHIYSAPAPAAQSSSSNEGISGLLALLAGTGAANVSIVPGATSLSLDADTLTGSSAAKGLLSGNPAAAKALDGLPGESWLAIGVGNLGASLPQDIQGLRTLSSLGSTPGVSSPESAATSGLSIKSLIGALSVPLSVLGGSSAQAKHDFSSWMGSAGIFASGSSLLELKAAIVVESKDPALSRAAVGKLAGQLRKTGESLRPVTIPGTEAATGVALNGLPVILDIAAGKGSDGQSEFVLGFGDASVEAALNPPSAMAGAAPHSAAATALGEGVQPSLMADFPTLLSLLEGVNLTADPSISKFVPYLRALSTLAGGGHDLGGEVQRFRLALGLQQSNG